MQAQQGAPQTFQDEEIFDDSRGSPGIWVAFTSGVVVLLILDTWVSARQNRPDFTEALKRTACWVSLGLAMNCGSTNSLGPGLERSFLACYLLERA